MSILYPRNIFEAVTIIIAVGLLSFYGMFRTSAAILLISYSFWIWQTRHDRGYLIFKPEEVQPIPKAQKKNRHITNFVTETLSDYGLDNVFLEEEIPGSVVTRHLIRVPKGRQIKKLPDADIARDLGVESISINTNAGRSLISVDVPNKKRQDIVFDELLETDEWKQACKTMKLPAMPGVDVTGKPFIFDIAKTPHLIIGGTTGAGKSVYANAILLSAIASGKPFKLIISDGKGEDFAPYYHKCEKLLKNETIKGIATEVEDMVHQVQWLEMEMDRRFSGESDKSIPIIYMSDEQADIALQDKDGSIDKSLTRVSQKGRSASMHNIICTQSPNADVLSKTLRANIPSRIGMTTGKGKESEIILDEWGAEKLLGMGDSLVKLTGSGKLTRVHGALITDRHLKTFI